jgi:excisionase family DNA binding protein
MPDAKSGVQKPTAAPPVKRRVPNPPVPPVTRPPRPNLSVPYIAQHLGTHPATVIREIERGELVAYRVGSRWRVTSEDFASYLAERRNKP